MTMTAQQLQTISSLNLQNSPVAIGFLDSPPAGLGRIERPDAAGCGYWKTASEGRSFYTTAEDHKNCPVGAMTHGVQLSTEETQGLMGLVGTMIELKYLASEEVPSIPRRREPFK